MDAASRVSLARLQWISSGPNRSHQVNAAKRPRPSSGCEHEARLCRPNMQIHQNNNNSNNKACVVQSRSAALPCRQMRQAAVQSADRPNGQSTHSASLGVAVLFLGVLQFGCIAQPLSPPLHAMRWFVVWQTARYFWRRIATKMNNNKKIPMISLT